MILVDTHIIRILAQPDLTKESSHGLKELMDVTTENLRALKILKVEVDSWDPILLLLLVQKLDHTTRKLWEQKLEPKVRPTIKQFLDFLSTRFHALGCQQNFSFTIGDTIGKDRYKKERRPFYNREDSKHLSNYRNNCFHQELIRASTIQLKVNGNVHSSVRNHTMCLTVIDLGRLIRARKMI